jgi:hypothetical protein
MTGQPTTAAERSEDKHEHSFLASFSQADLRLFLITFAGTVAANVITVMVVAVAVILTRPPMTLRPNVDGVVTLLAFSVIGLAFVITNVALLRRKRPRHPIDPTMKVYLLTMTIFAGLLASEGLLILLGWAVGVK